MAKSRDRRPKRRAADPRAARPASASGEGLRTLDGALAEANRLLAANRVDEAEAACRGRLEQAPNDVDAWHILGMIALRRGQIHDAIACHDRGLELAPGSIPHRCGRAKAQMMIGRFDEAMADYDGALRDDPACVQARVGRAELFERLGRFDEAEAIVTPLAERDPPVRAALLPAVTLRQRRGDHEGAEALAARGLAHADVPPALERLLLFARGSSLEKLGRHDEAFPVYARANRLFQQPFRAEDVRERFELIKRIWAADALGDLPRTAVEDERPIFVISMPRCGSTLVEQILAAHPRVHGAGEINEMMLRVQELGRAAGRGGDWPAFARTIGVDALEGAATRYLDAIGRLGGDAARVVDKNLQNFRLLGLIGQLFPKARAIWCRRDPMATCWSCWTLPLSPVVLPYTTDLANLGRYHRLYADLMRHWLEVQPIPVLEVTYESLVEDQEAVSRRIVDFAGLDWDDRCLRFHESGRKVATASYDQVRRPMYRSALQRYAPYARHLGPLRDALADD